MASRAAHDAVKDRFAAGFTRCPILGVNEASEPPADGTAYAMLQFPVASEDHVGLGQVGARTFRETGVARFILHWPRSDGVESALDWIDEIRALFRAAQFDGVSTFSPSPAVVNDDNDLGTYFVVSTAVEFHHDIQA